MNARLKDGIVALLNKNNVNGIKLQVPDLVPFFEFYCIFMWKFQKKIPNLELPQELRVGLQRLPLSPLYALRMPVFQVFSAKK